MYEEEGGKEQGGRAYRNKVRVFLKKRKNIVEVIFKILKTKLCKMQDCNANQHIQIR